MNIEIQPIRNPDRQSPRQINFVETAKDIVTELKTGKIERVERLKSGSGENFFIEFEDGGKAILKIIDLNAEKYEKFPDHTGPGGLDPKKMERAAYLVSRILKFGSVPETVLRKKLSFGDNIDPEEIDDLTAGRDEEDQVVIQKFVPGKTAAELEGGEFSMPDELLLEMSIFDYIIANADRNTGNYIFQKNKIHTIDNELSFGEEFYGEIIDALTARASRTEISDKLRSICERFAKNRDQMIDKIRGKLGQLMPERYMNACISRIEKIVDLVSRHKKLVAKDISGLTFE